MAKEDKPTADASQVGGTTAGDSQDQIDDFYKGKSLDEIIKMHKELKSHSDRQLEQLKSEKDKEMEALKTDLLPYKSWYETHGVPNQPQQTQANPQFDKEKFMEAFYEDPLGTFEHLYTTRRKQEVYKEAFEEGPVALKKAKSERPDIFEGVDENRLNQLMYGGIQSGTILPQFAKNPEAWKFLAGNTRLAQNDYRFGPPPSPQPTNPPQGDLPPRTRPQVDEPGDEVPFTEQAKFIVNALRDESPDEVNIEKVKERVQKMSEDRQRQGE